jgi:outer membrane protein assembly factor BamD (BamD/ComL family)
MGIKKLKLWVPLWGGMLLWGLGGCGEDPKQLFETAQFEEQQNNQAHAHQLYERIVQDHPESDWAKKAKARLLAMDSKKVKKDGMLNVD